MTDQTPIEIDDFANRFAVLDSGVSVVYRPLNEKQYTVSVAEIPDTASNLELVESIQPLAGWSVLSRDYDIATLSPMSVSTYIHATFILSTV